MFDQNINYLIWDKMLFDNNQHYSQVSIQSASCPGFQLLYMGPKITWISFNLYSVDFTTEIRSIKNCILLDNELGH
jgi:hypothetical protein